MKRTLLVAGLLMGLGAASAQSNSGDTVGVAMVNSLHDITYTQAQCIQKASVAIKAAGFTENFQIVKNSVYGDQAAYTALVRCVADSKLAFMVTAGPDSDVADQYLSDIEDNF